MLDTISVDCAELCTDEVSTLKFQHLLHAEPLTRHWLELQGAGWLQETRREIGEELFAFALLVSLKGLTIYRLEEMLPAQIEEMVKRCLAQRDALEDMRVEYAVLKSSYRLLHERERARREAIWRLEALRPGHDAVRDILSVLDRIEEADRDAPIGPGINMEISGLREIVPIIDEPGKISYVDVDDIPEPWCERFEQASVGSTRPMAEGYVGAYAGDWLKFLSCWKLEMELIARHRKAFHIP